MNLPKINIGFNGRNMSFVLTLICQTLSIFEISVASVLVHMTVPVTGLSKPASAFVTSERLVLEVAPNVVPHVRYLTCNEITVAAH